MNQAFTIVSSDEIIENDVHKLIQEAHGTLTPEEFGEGYLEYNHIYVWVSMGKISHRTEDEIAEETQLLGFPPRSVIVLEASSKDQEISGQLVYDFCYLCIQKFHCVLDTHFIVNDETGSTHNQLNIIKRIAEQRIFSDLVPPPPSITQQSQGTA